MAIQIRRIFSTKDIDLQTQGRKGDPLERI